MAALERAEVTWGTTSIPFAIRRSARRTTVSLSIDGSALVVTAPPEVPAARLGDVVRAKARWVVPRLKRATPEAAPRDFETGETVLYRGRQLRLQVLETPAKQAPRLHAGWVLVPIPPGLAAAARRDEIRRRLASWLREHARRVLPMMLAELCARLRLTVPPLAVRHQHKRWGSCDTKGMVRINWRIIQAAPSLIDYVLTHELVHLTHRTHGPSFWSRLGELMPDYEPRRLRLREVGPLLLW
ncbi:MAG: SprT family zinc-dependent metalloprotease [Byssovorax sp.]